MKIPSDDDSIQILSDYIINFEKLYNQKYYENNETRALVLNVANGYRVLISAMTEFLHLNITTRGLYNYFINNQIDCNILFD